MKKYLILGASGFLGSCVAGRLSEAGYFLRLFDIHFDRARLGDIRGAEFVKGDFNSRNDLLKALDGVDGVLYFVGSSVPVSSKSLMYEVEVVAASTARLMECMIETGCDFIGFPSSGGTVYGDSLLPHLENEQLRPTCQHGFGKLLSEEIIRYTAQSSLIKYQIWRIANPIGDVDSGPKIQGVVDNFVRCALEGEPVQVWGDGSAVRDYIYKDDLSEVLLLLLRGEHKNVTVNIGSGTSCSVVNVIETISKVMGKEVAVDWVDDGYTGPQVSSLNIDLLRELTGWEPVYSLDKAIKMMIGATTGNSR